MSDFFDLKLSSVTVFWEDIGLKSYRSQSTEDRDLYARWWSSVVDPWIEITLPNRGNGINPHEAGVWFANRRDAILFKIKFQHGLDGFQ